ncbi:hypothetical protein CDAR_533781 [Caerostris darwini]|uniref:Uncharacterized protein n=1 Tax=Caerostris darwini TaxID=1538125 RepID=A0AAV4S5F5_9ARAC|nr:hypothetical protein CDAR_533781 [Caerostris darwini]
MASFHLPATPSKIVFLATLDNRCVGTCHSASKESYRPQTAQVRAIRETRESSSSSTWSRCLCWGSKLRCDLTSYDYRISWH